MDGDGVVGFVGDDQLLAVLAELDALGLGTTDNIGNLLAFFQVEDGDARRLVSVVVSRRRRLARLRRWTRLGTGLVRDKRPVASNAHELRILADLDLADDGAAGGIDQRDTSGLARGHHQRLTVGGDADAARPLPRQVKAGGGLQGSEIEHRYTRVLAGDESLIGADGGADGQTGQQSGQQVRAKVRLEGHGDSRARLPSGRGASIDSPWRRGFSRG